MLYDLAEAGKCICKLASLSITFQNELLQILPPKCIATSVCQELGLRESISKKKKNSTKDIFGNDGTVLYSDYGDVDINPYVLKFTELYIPLIFYFTV